MATFSTAVVSARTTSGCTITFNAAAIDVNAASLKQLYKVFQILLADTANNEGSGGTGGTITLGALS